MHVHSATHFLPLMQVRFMGQCLLQIFLGDTKVLPSQLRYIIFSACSGFAPGSHSGWTCSWSSHSRGYALGILLGPPLMSPFDEEKQWLLPEPLLNVWAPHSVSKGKPRQCLVKGHFHHLYPWFCSIRHYSKLMNIGKGRNTDWPVKRQHCILSLSLPWEISTGSTSLQKLHKWTAWLSPTPFFPRLWIKPWDS